MRNFILGAVDGVLMAAWSKYFDVGVWVIFAPYLLGVIVAVIETGRPTEGEQR